MAINAAMNWWVRADGSDSNGGGFDSTVSGAGKNYCDQAAAQLSLSDLASTGSTTITSTTGGFTALVIGNVLRLAGGAGAAAGYYVVTAYTNANTITVDRVSGTYTAGVGTIGGAFAHFTSLTGGEVAVPSPLAAGHQINVRGAGTNIPVLVDYITTSSYVSVASVGTANGYISLVGYTLTNQLKGGTW